jgi:hypothetical protein
MAVMFRDRSVQQIFGDLFLSLLFSPPLFSLLPFHSAIAVYRFYRTVLTTGRYKKTQEILRANEAKHRPIKKTAGDIYYKRLYLKAKQKIYKSV